MGRGDRDNSRLVECTSRSRRRFLRRRMPRGFVEATVKLTRQFPGGRLQFLIQSHLIGSFSFSLQFCSDADRLVDVLEVDAFAVLQVIVADVQQLVSTAELLVPVLDRGHRELFQQSRRAVGRRQLVVHVDS